MSLLRAVFVVCSLTLVLSSCNPSQASPAPETAPAEAQDEVLHGTLEVPTESGSLAPSLTRLGDGRVLLTWLQATDGGHELRYGTVGPRGVAASKLAGRAEDLFANWADRPALHVLQGGQLAAHWLRRLGDETYAYGVEIVRLSTAAAGRAESPGFWLHDDTTPTEHGFVSSLRGDDATRFFWLDGRAMAEDGPMALRSTTVDARGAAPSEVIDSRVCECCPTDAATTSEGPVVVYRDRSDDEIRDIYIVRRTDGGWSDPQPVADDGWRIEGCPVNGPAVDADGERVAVAWFTGASGQPRVQLAWSSDAGASFEPLLVLDDDRPVGRVDVEVSGNVAYVSWLARRDGQGAVVLATVPLGAARAPEARVVVSSGLGRSAGYPRIALAGDDLLLAWVGQIVGDEAQEAGTSRVRLLRLPLSEAAD